MSDASPRVGFDARLWRHTGIGRYSENLLAHLAGPGWVIWVRPEDRVAARAAWPAAEVRVCQAAPFSLAEQLFWARELLTAPIDLFHSPHLNAPLRCPVPLVVTLHDLIPLRFRGTINRPAGLVYFSLMARLAAHRATRVIAVSEHTARDIESLLGVPRERQRVILEGADPRFAVPVPLERQQALREQFGLRGRYVLYAGQWKRYKNLETLITAFAGLGEAFGDVKLALVGRVDPNAPHVGEAIARHGLAARVVTPGYLPDDRDLVALFQGASVFAFPSRYEGFGLPPLEAMAAGVPVVSSRAAALREVVGDAAWTLSPDDTPGWTHALEVLLENPAERERYVAAGRAHVKTFDWAQAAGATASVYQELIGQVPRPASGRR